MSERQNANTVHKMEFPSRISMGAGDTFKLQLELTICADSPVSVDGLGIALFRKEAGRDIPISVESINLKQGPYYPEVPLDMSSLSE